MTDQELQQLAMEYAKQYPPLRVPEISKVDRDSIIDTVTDYAVGILRWLTKTHCIVSHKDVKEWVENASCFMPTSNLQKAMKFGAKKLFGEATFEEDSESARKSSNKTTDNI